jgi:hypothetical protein
VNYFRQQYVSPGSVVSTAAAGTAPSMPDIAAFISQGLVAPLVQGISQVALNFSETMGSMGGLAARSTRTHRGATQKHGCGCETEEPCHCTCCIVDADVAVYTHLGETRILTFVLTNDRIRPKSIHVAAGPFLDRTGKPAPIKGVLFPPTEFELAPCTSKAVVMAIETGPLGTPGAIPNEPIPDVEDCTVYYSDLRIDGCEMRPLRIAVAILPRECGAYKIHCHSCCCC